MQDSNDNASARRTSDTGVETRSPPSIAQPLQGWRRLVLLVLAGLLFLIGVVGAILPGLPATPFLLLTSYLLLRSSPRLNAVLLRSRFFGPILTDWQRHRGVRRNVRRKAIVAVVVAVLVTIYVSDYSQGATIGVALLALIGIGVIFRLPTIESN